MLEYHVGEAYVRIGRRLIIDVEFNLNWEWTVFVKDWVKKMSCNFCFDSC